MRKKTKWRTKVAKAAVILQTRSKSTKHIWNEMAESSDEWEEEVEVIYGLFKFITADFWH